MNYPSKATFLSLCQDHSVSQSSIWRAASSFPLVIGLIVKANQSYCYPRRKVLQAEATRTFWVWVVRHQASTEVACDMGGQADDLPRPLLLPECFVRQDGLEDTQHRQLQQKKRQNYAFRHQIDEKPSIIPGCPGMTAAACPSVSMYIKEP